MRNIKFRAKAIDTNNWVYGYYVQRNEFDDKGIIMPLLISGSNNVNHSVYSKTVSELVFEINGEEIYRGDIFKGKHTFENSNEYPLYYLDWDEKEISYVLRSINGSITLPLSSLITIRNGLFSEFFFVDIIINYKARMCLQSHTEA
ncbi:MAG: hypothetical protein ACK40G_13880 [Cytophagaceae bacterium]